MSEPLKRFEKMLQAQMGKRTDAIRAAAKKHPVGYRQWIQAAVAGTPYTAQGFDKARGKLEALGLPRGQAMRECARHVPAAHSVWLTDYNDKLRSQSSQKENSRKPQAAAGATAAAHATRNVAAHGAGAAVYTAAVARHQAEGSTRGQAMSKAKRDDPEAFFAWVAERNENNRQGGTSVSQSQASRAAASAPSLDASPPAHRIDGPVFHVNQHAVLPVVAAAPQPAAAGPQSGALPALNAEALAALRKRWEGSPALRAVHGDDFKLMLAHHEGRVTWEEVKSLREATASAESRKMWASWEASQKRVF